MECYRILLVALLSLNGALSEYYPHDPHVNYDEPAHVEHVKPIKYIQPAPIAPVAHYAPIAPVVKHIAPAPALHKYVHPEPHYVKQVEYEQPAHYEYGYDVHDSHTGDIKSHSEKRDGHSVQGRYEVLDPDGYKRIVEYTADEHNGFNAVVRREPSDVKIAPVAPVKYLAPQPEIVAHAAPVQKVYSPVVPQKVIAPIVKQYVAQPQYYAPPENPKYFKPVEKVAKFFKPANPYEQYTGVNYHQPSPPQYHQY